MKHRKFKTFLIKNRIVLMWIEVILFFGTIFLGAWETGEEYTHWIGMCGIVLNYFYLQMLITIAFPNWFSEFAITESDRKSHYFRLNEFNEIQNGNQPIN